MMRRFATKSLKDHGFGKQTAETFILEEAQYSVDYINKLRHEVAKGWSNVEQFSKAKRGQAKPSD